MAWQRRWLRCTKLKICTILIAGLIITAACRIHSFLKTTRCRNDEMKENFNDLCHLYKASEVVGDLCHRLCISHEVLLQECLGSRLGKQIAAAKWQNDMIILKSQMRFMHDFDLLASFDNELQVYVFPSDEMFYTLLHDTITSRLGRTVSETGTKLMARMWPHNYGDFLHHSTVSKHHATAMNSIWSLTQQSEYVLLQYFNENKYLPRVLGTCGHVYAVEYLPSGLLDPDLFYAAKSDTWRKRAQLALGILDLLSSFEKDFEEPLHMCDIKGSNFGVTKDGQVRAVDVDTVFFLSDLQNQVQGNCTRHKDCDFFDCQARCDVTAQRCQKKVLNNNLQVVCQKLFKGSLSGFLHGLLNSPPPQFRDQLQMLLDHCANPTNDHTDRRGAASWEDFQKMYQLLKDTLL